MSNTSVLHFHVSLHISGRHVMYSYFSPVQSSLLATIYSPAPEVCWSLSAWNTCRLLYWYSENSVTKWYTC